MFRIENRDHWYNTVEPEASAAFTSPRRPALLATIGCLALAIGGLVYLADREAAHAMLMPSVAALAGSRLFGVFGQWLPSFVHPFAFSLFTAAVLPTGSAPRYGACAAWCTVNIVFELGQWPQASTHIAQVLRDRFGHAPLAQAFANYLVRGTFDGGDIAAVILGALAAAAVLRWTHAVPEADHAQ